MWQVESRSSPSASGSWALKTSLIPMGDRERTRSFEREVAALVAARGTRGVVQLRRAWDEPLTAALLDTFFPPPASRLDAEDFDEDEVVADVRAGTAELEHVRLACLQLEFVRGRPLSASLPMHQRVAAFADLTRAVRALHHAGVVHCDLKPDNVLLDESNGIVTVVDLGAAHVVVVPASSSSPSSLTSSSSSPTSEHDHQLEGEYLGTACYAAPEVSPLASGTLPSPAADVFSLGVMLAELALAPFSTAMERARMLSALSNPTHRTSGVSLAFLAHPQAHLLRLAMRMTERDPHARPTMDEVLAHLEQTHARLPAVSAAAAAAASAPDIPMMSA